MEVCLSYYLPVELVDIIMKMVWDMSMKDVHLQLTHNIVWIRVNDGYSFLVSNNKNYYTYLEDEWKLSMIRVGKQYPSIDMWE